MSYTSEEQLRTYLSSVRAVSETVSDQLVVLPDTDPVTFYDGPIAADMLAVKSSVREAINRNTLTLADGATSIGATFLQRGSVLTASDSSLGTIYTENRDFTVDYAAGTIRIKSDGSLQAGDSIVLWYRTHCLFEPGVDYSLDSERGTIRRLAGGDIAPNEAVLIDYRPVWAAFADALIQRSVNEANAAVQQRVDPSTRFSADQSLAAAATYLALGHICRASALRTLSARQGQDQAARAWLQVASEFSAMAETILDSYQPPKPRPSSPTHV